MDHLGPEAEFPSSFPKSGKIHGNNKRLIVGLSEEKYSKPMNIIFLFDKAVEKLVGKPECNVGTKIDVMIHTKKL